MNHARARELRRDQTEVEKRLWRYLRRRQLAGAKFRRQQPIGRYIVDFVCFEQQLIVELDGGQHNDNVEIDARRTAWLESEGSRVMRFWNNDVTANIDGVLETILRELQKS